MPIVQTMDMFISCCYLLDDPHINHGYPHLLLLYQVIKYLDTNEKSVVKRKSF